jgi:hypothetical protein
MCICVGNIKVASRNDTTDRKPARQPKIWSFQNKITGKLAIANYEDTENLFLVFRKFAIFPFLSPRYVSFY